MLSSISLNAQDDNLKYLAKSYIYRIKVYTPNGQILTQNGCLIKGKGIYTTLHGVSNTEATITGTTYHEIDKTPIKLRLVKVDIENDIALLMGDGLDISVGYEMLSIENVKESSNIYSFGFSAGVRTILPTKKLSILTPSSTEEITLRLLDILPDAVISDFRKLKSPSTMAKVLMVDNNFGPGDSGSPILLGEKVVSILDGGIETIDNIGRRNYNKNWTIPVSGIKLSFISNEIKKELTKINSERSSLYNSFSEFSEDKSGSELRSVKVLRRFDRFLSIEYGNFFNSSRSVRNRHTVDGMLSVDYSYIFKNKYRAGIGGSILGVSFISNRETLPNLMLSDTLNMPKWKFNFNFQYYFFPLYSRRFNLSTGFSFSTPKSFQLFTALSAPIWRKNFIELKAGYSLLSVNQPIPKFNIFGDAEQEKKSIRYNTIYICVGIHFCTPYSYSFQ